MDNSKGPSFGRSDKQIADAFGMSVSDFKKVKKQIVSDMTKPKTTSGIRPTVKDVEKARTAAKAAPKKTSPKVGYGKDGFKPSAKPATPKPKASAMPRGEAAAKQYQKEISPKGMASAKAAQSKALDKKYPGLYKKSK